MLCIISSSVAIRDTYITTNYERVDRGGGWGGDMGIRGAGNGGKGGGGRG